MLKSGFLTFSGDIEMEHWFEMVKLAVRCCCSITPENIRKPDGFLMVF